MSEGKSSVIGSSRSPSVRSKGTSIKEASFEEGASDISRLNDGEVTGDESEAIYIDQSEEDEEEDEEEDYEEGNEDDYKTQEEEEREEEEEEEEEEEFGEDYFLEYQDQFGSDETFRTLDARNIPDLINMLSKVRLVWPEDLPNFDENVYRTDPTRMGFPESFFRCTPKEKAVMWHAENFRKQFAHVYRDRRPLLIAPRNECDTQKLFPTYIAPAVLGYPEFYDAESTAKFMKDFFNPQFLRPPTRMPRRIRSHVTLFKDRKANSYEICTVIVSILNGSGYDSYVVDGYATKEITTMCDREDFQDIEENGGFKVDETDFYVRPDELVEDEPEKPEEENEEEKDENFYIFGSADDVTNSGPPSPSKYKIKPPKEFGSEYEKEMQKRSDQKEEEGRMNMEREAHEEEMKNQRPPTPDPLYGFRPHAWVLVKKGARGVEESFFLEPFTGVRKDLNDPNFLGIEAIFNEKNYYANIQDCSAGIAGISFDLNDKSKWAKLLLEPPCRRRCGKLDDDEEDEEEEGGTQFAFNMDEEEEAAPPCEKYLDMPVSWTTEMDMTQADYEKKFPDGSKIHEYNDAFVETAAPWVSSDGLIKKIIKFDGRTRDPKKLLYIEEQFAHRADKLMRRKWFKENRELHEYFDKGRRDCLKEHVHQSGKNKPHHPRHLYYYADMHPQNVSHREVVKNGLIEEFEGRDDLLYYRAIYYGGFLCHTIPDKAKSNKARELLDLMRGEDRANNSKPRKKILRIDEKYHRNPLIPDPDNDIAEKYLLLSEGKINVNFHYGNEQFTRKSLEFFKPRGVDFDSVDFRPEDCNEYRVDPFAPYTSNYERFLILQMLGKDELRASSAARQAEDDIYLTVTRRVQEDWSHEMDPNNPYTQADSTANEKQISEGSTGEDLTGIDFATPYIEKYGAPSSKREEIVLKQKIILDARNRIIKKAKHIQKEYNLASAELKTKMEWYDKVKESLTQQDDEQFQAYYKDELFKMHIMEQRLIRHREKAPQYFNKLLFEVLRHPVLNVYANKKLSKEEKSRRQRAILEKEEIREKEKAFAKLPKDICCNYRFKFEPPKNVEESNELTKVL